jgi:hypothetical protein
MRFGVGILMMIGTLVTSFSLVLLLGPPPAPMPASGPNEVTAEVVQARLFTWLEPDRGPLDGGVLTVRLENRGAETLNLRPSGAEVTGARGLLQTCGVYAAHAQREGEKRVVGRPYDYVLKPKMTLVVRMLFSCPAVKGNHVILHRAMTYGVALTLSWAGGQVRVAAPKVNPTQHPGRDGGF